MTSLSVTQEAIENALVNRYSGFFMDVDGSSTEVQVFLEVPSSESTSNRVFPSVSIQYSGEVDDDEDRESSSEDYEETAYNDLVFPNERSVRRIQKPIRIRYLIDTWHRDLAAEDQVLYHEILRRRTPREGYLAVTNIDGVPIDLWIFKVGDTTVRNEVDVDTVIYHKSVLVEVLAHLSEVEYDEVVTDKVAHYVDWVIKARKGNFDEKGILESVDDANSVIDLEFRVTEDGEEKLS